MTRSLLLPTVLAATFALATPAAAATSPRVDRVTCGSGDSRFECVAAVTGGAAPFQTRWEVVNGTATDVLEFNASGPCALGRKVTATITVTDATGQTARGTDATTCREVWPMR